MDFISIDTTGIPIESKQQSPPLTELKLRILGTPREIAEIKNKICILLGEMSSTTQWREDR